MHRGEVAQAGQVDLANVHGRVAEVAQRGDQGAAHGEHRVARLVHVLREQALHQPDGERGLRIPLVMLGLEHSHSLIGTSILT